VTAPKPRVVGLNAPELGRLADGTPYFAPPGEFPYDPEEDKVQCHLCGDWFRLVGASHLRWHGWTLDDYREAFHLLRKTSSAAAGVSDKLRRNAIARKRTNERWANPPRSTTPDLAGRGVPRWRSLAALRPHLASELHPTRNGDLDPTAIGLGSTRRVSWQCGTCGFEWPTSIRYRVATDAGCRRCTSPAWRVPRERSLAVLRPDLASELHPTRNGDLDPFQLGAGSHRRLWWRCRSRGHEWRSAVKGRSGAGYGCPRCARERRATTAQHVPRERSLAVLRPGLASVASCTRPATATSIPTTSPRCRAATRGGAAAPAATNGARCSAHEHADTAARHAASARRSDSDGQSRVGGPSPCYAPTSPPSCTRPATATSTPSHSRAGPCSRSGGAARPASTNGRPAPRTGRAAPAAAGGNQYRPSGRSPRCAPTWPPSCTRRATVSSTPTRSAPAPIATCGGSAPTAGGNGKPASPAASTARAGARPVLNAAAR
jgi:hypothetical protein